LEPLPVCTFLIEILYHLIFKMSITFLALVGIGFLPSCVCLDQNRNGCYLSWLNSGYRRVDVQAQVQQVKLGGRDSEHFQIPQKNNLRIEKTSLLATTSVLFREACRSQSIIFRLRVLEKKKFGRLGRSAWIRRRGENNSAHELEAPEKAPQALR
jgi:hypothetical protein